MYLNPFAADVYPDGYGARTGVQVLHGAAEERLREMVGGAAERVQQLDGSEGGGTVVLLRAVRAGFGKSHLLARLEATAGDVAAVVRVEPDASGEVSWSSLLWQVLAAWHRSGADRVSRLDVLARGLFALVNEGLIAGRRVPCAQPETAMAALRERAVELFDFSDPEQAVAQWYAGHFERLLPASAAVLGAAAGVPDAAAAHWLRVLLAYCQGSEEGETARWEALRWAVLQPASAAVARDGMSMVTAGPPGETGARERLVEFCRLAAVRRPVVFVFDHLDLLHQQPAQILRVAGCISELRRLVARSVVVLSVNQDLWAQSFLKSLPSAVEDRLTGQQITLGGICQEEAEALLRGRLELAGETPDAVQAFMREAHLATFFAQEAGRMVSPRTVLRHAAALWESRRRAPKVPVSGNAGVMPPSEGFPVVTGVPEPPPTAEPTPPAPLPAVDPSFQKLRETLNRLRTSGPRQGSPFLLEPEEVDETPRTVLPDPPPPTGERVPSGFSAPAVAGGLSPVPVVVSRQQGLNARFHQLRTHFLSAPWLAVDSDRLFHLLKIAGQRLAVVRWEEKAVPGLQSQQAGVWHVPDGELWFGAEPHDDHAYWSALIDSVRERSRHAARPVRLVVFSSVQAPVPLQSWLPPDEIIEARTRFLEILTVDQATLASLYAAGELLRESERGALGAGTGETFSCLAPHIEFLWKELSRVGRRVGG